jgi:hypothetical protein
MSFELQYGAPFSMESMGCIFIESFSDVGVR